MADYKVSRTDGGDIGDAAGSVWNHSGNPLQDALDTARGLSLNDPDHAYRVAELGGMAATGKFVREVVVFHHGVKAGD